MTAFDLGGTPEEIAQDFPVLRLDDVYAVLTYYLRHREEVQAYLSHRERLAGEVRETVADASQAGLRNRLRARLGRRG